MARSRWDAARSCVPNPELDAAQLVGELFVLLGQRHELRRFARGAPSHQLPLLGLSVYVFYVYNYLSHRQN